MDSFEAAEAKLFEITARVSELFGQAKVLITGGQLEQGAARLDQIGCAYMDLANLLRERAKEEK